MNDTNPESGRILRPPPIAIAAQIVKCLTNAALLGFLGYVLIRFPEGGTLPVMAFAERSWKLGCAALFGFLWANIFTQKTLFKKSSDWEIAFGPNDQGGYLGSDILAFLNIAIRWLIIPVVNIVFVWWIQTSALTLLSGSPIQAAWLVVLLLSVVLLPFIVPVLDLFLLIPLAWVSGMCNRVTTAFLAREVDRSYNNSEDDLLESASEDSGGSEGARRHSPLSILFAWLALSCYILLLGSLLHWKWVLAIPVVGRHPALWAIGLCWVFSYLSSRFDRYEATVLANGFTAMISNLPSQLKVGGVTLIQLAFAFVLFGWLFYGIGRIWPADHPLAWTVRLGSCYTLGYMLSRFYLRVHPFRCDEDRASFRWRGFFLTTFWVIAFLGFMRITSFVYLLAVLAPLYSTILFYTGNSIFRGDRRYIVFLRRFDRYADRVLLGPVLNALPGGLSAAFLISRRNRLVTWDPWVSLLNGRIWQNPATGLPCYFISKDETWEDNVQKLLIRATAVVMDVSDPSDSIRHELCLVAAQQLSKRTLFLMPHSSAERSRRFLREHGVDISQASIVEFTPSWTRAIPRMLIGLVGAFNASVFLLYTAESTICPFLTRLQTNSLCLISTLLLFGLFFLKPALDGTSTRAIREFLRRNRYDTTPEDGAGKAETETPRSGA